MIDADEFLPPRRRQNRKCLPSRRAVAFLSRSRNQSLQSVRAVSCVDGHLVPRKRLSGVAGQLRTLETGTHIVEVSRPFRRSRHGCQAGGGWYAFLTPLLRPEEESFLFTLVI